MHLTRRQFTAGVGGTLAGLACGLRNAAAAEAAGKFQLNYILASPMYGTAPLAEVLGEVRKIGATSIDIWPRPHANHREQVAELGLEPFARLLQEQQVRLGMITRYDLGPYRLQDELRVLKQLGGRVLVTGARDAEGKTLRDRVQAFVESLQPHVAVARGVGGGDRHREPRPLADLHAGLDPLLRRVRPRSAPGHRPGSLSSAAGGRRDRPGDHGPGPALVHFQAWQHGRGCMEKLPKDQELLQMPGRGTLDFTPLLKALKQIDYRGFTEIFMHPVPRGIPILETTAAVTAEINRRGSTWRSVWRGPEPSEGWGHGRQAGHATPDDDSRIACRCDAAAIPCGGTPGRNPKHEAPNKSEASRTNSKRLRTVLFRVLNFEFDDFGFVSDFEFRAWDFAFLLASCQAI